MKEKIYIAAIIVILTIGLVARYSYNIGLDKGRTAGYIESYLTGYDEGYTDGRDDGYSKREVYENYIIVRTADNGYYYKTIGNSEYKIKAELVEK